MWMVNMTESIQIYKHCVKSVQFLLVRISPYSVPIRENTDQKKLHIWTLFTQCKIVLNGKNNSNYVNQSTK